MCAPPKPKASRAGGTITLASKTSMPRQKAVERHGGRVLVPPTDIPPGRLATIASPSGAISTLFHEADSNDADTPTTPGFVHWVDLHSTDLQADLAFIHDALGLQTTERPMLLGPTDRQFPRSVDLAGLGGRRRRGRGPRAGDTQWGLAWDADDVGANGHRRGSRSRGITNHHAGRSRLNSATVGGLGATNRHPVPRDPSQPTW